MTPKPVYTLKIVKYMDGGNEVGFLLIFKQNAIKFTCCMAVNPESGFCRAVKQLFLAGLEIKEQLFSKTDMTNSSLGLPILILE